MLTNVMLIFIHSQGCCKFFLYFVFSITDSFFLIHVRDIIANHKTQFSWIMSGNQASHPQTLCIHDVILQWVICKVPNVIKNLSYGYFLWQNHVVYHDISWQIMKWLYLIQRDNLFANFLVYFFSLTGNVPSMPLSGKHVKLPGNAWERWPQDVAI